MNGQFRTARVKLVATLGCAVVAAAVLRTAHRSYGGFSFEAFERRDSTNTNVNDAAQALSSRLPTGTMTPAYDDFFHALGGRCVQVSDTRRFPNTVLCTYAHGSLITAEWRLVDLFDPATMQSRRQDLSFGLTGP